MCILKERRLVEDYNKCLLISEGLSSGRVCDHLWVVERHLFFFFKHFFISQSKKEGRIKTSVMEENTD